MADEYQLPDVEQGQEKVPNMPLASPVVSSHASRDWEKAALDPSHWIPNCVVYFFCCPCSIFCRIPYHGAAMARKIGWKGFSRKDGDYAKNKWCLQTLGIITIIFFALSCTLFLIHSSVEPLRWYPGIDFFLRFSEIVGGLALTIYMAFFTLLRLKMRRAMNLNASWLICFGDVGDYLEDALCITSCCFPCAMSQMAEQVDTPVALFCTGEDPGTVDSAVVNFDV